MRRPGGSAYKPETHLRRKASVPLITSGDEYLGSRNDEGRS